MALMQTVFVLIWDWEERVWKTEVEGSAVQGTWGAIAQKLGEADWEIVAVTPMKWWTTYESKVPGVLDKSHAIPELVAITAKKQSDEKATD